MADLKLDIAFWNYDRTRALADRTTKIPGIAATYHTAPIVTQIFEGVIGVQYQVSELGFSFFLRTFSRTANHTSLQSRANVDVHDIPKGKELGAMLEAGEIDALISADNPKCIIEQSPRVGRLFQDYTTVEAEYYAATGIFPIMHTVVLRKNLLRANPSLAQTVYDSFC